MNGERAADEGDRGDHGYSHDVNLRIRMSWRWGWYPGPFGQRKIYDAAAG
jgi:hypothetical protein